MKSLWNVVRAFNERRNLVPLPSYIRIAFTESKMAHDIRREPNSDVCLIRRCIEALVVNKLTADINSRNVPVSNDELACLSAILGTKNDEAMPTLMLLLRHPGAIELTNMVFLTLDNHYASNFSAPADVVQETLRILSQALPPELKAATQLDQTYTLMNDSDGQSEVVL